MNKQQNGTFSLAQPLILLLALALSSVAQAASKIYYVHTDHLGTPQVLTDQNQNVVWKGEYTPFGEVKEVVNALGQNVRLPGQYHDRETGYYYNYYRDYDPALGRYLQSDPIGFAGGINTYAYVGGNPINLVDPLGLWSTEAHNYLINQLGLQRGWSSGTVSNVQNGSAYADNFFRDHQSADNSFMHAMTSSAITSKSAACKKANNFIDKKLSGYRNWGSGSSNYGQNNFIAESSLGMALHTIMDNRSPAHEGFQMWDNSQIGRHGDNISFTPFGSHTEEDLNALLANPSLMQQILQDMNNLIDSGTGIDCSCY